MKPVTHIINVSGGKDSTAVTLLAIDRLFAAGKVKKPHHEGGNRVTKFYPLREWLVDDVFAFLKGRGIDVNPLYELGADRVGCLPCIYSRLVDIKIMAEHFPDEIRRVAEMEEAVAKCSRKGVAAIKPAPTKSLERWAKKHGKRFNIEQMVRYVRGADVTLEKDLVEIMEEFDKPGEWDDHIRCGEMGLCEMPSPAKRKETK